MQFFDERKNAEKKVDTKSDTMISEEEFVVFQQQMNDIRKESFKLKDQLKEATQKNAEFKELMEKIAKLEQESLDNKKRNDENVAALRAETANLKKKYAELTEQNLKEQQEKTKILNDDIERYQQKVQLKEDKITIIGQNVKEFDQRFSKKKAQLNALKTHSHNLQPVVEVLKRARNYPMYIEDLKQQNKKSHDKVISLQNVSLEKSKKIEMNAKFITSLDAKLKQKNNELSQSNTKLNNSKSRMETAQKEIHQTEEAIASAEVRLHDAEVENKNFEKKSEEEVQQINEENEKLKEKLQKLKDEVAEKEKEFEEEKEEMEVERSKWKEEVARLRKDVTVLKDTGMDPTLPRVDLELKAQIASIQGEKAQLRKDIADLEIQLTGKKREIDTIEFQLQNQTLKQQPTLKLQQNADFQIKQLLMEELIIQNREIQDEIISMNAEIHKLKEESNRIKGSLK